MISSLAGNEITSLFPVQADLKFTQAQKWKETSTMAHMKNNTRVHQFIFAGQSINTGMHDIDSANINPKTSFHFNIHYI